MTSRDGQAAGQSVLDEIKDGYAISDGTEHRVAVGREDEVALLVQRPAQVRKLQTEASDTTRHTHVRRSNAIINTKRDAVSFITAQWKAMPRTS
jgi:hypothetical protein